MAYFDFNTPITEYITLIARYELKRFTFTIPATPNQTVVVECNGVRHTSSSTSPISFQTIYGQTWKLVSAMAAENYVVGTFSAVDGVVTDNITLSVPSVTPKVYTITIVQPENGNIKVNDSLTTTQTFTYNTSINVLATANDGFYVNTLEVEDAPPTMYSFTIPATTNQTIKVVFNGTTTYTSTSSQQVLSLEYGTSWIARVEASSGYKPGVLNKSNGPLSSNTVLSVTAATKITD